MSAVTARMRALIMFGITAIYAVCFALIKTGLNYAPPFRFAGLRSLIGGIALVGFAAAGNRPLLPQLRGWPWLSALAYLSFGKGGTAMEEWIRANWVFLLFFIFFIAMHMFGHGMHGGGCGGHGGHGEEEGKEHKGHDEGTTGGKGQKGGHGIC